jgi:hypothetical protein
MFFADYAWLVGLMAVVGGVAAGVPGDGIESRFGSASRGCFGDLNGDATKNC